MATSARSAATSRSAAGGGPDAAGSVSSFSTSATTTGSKWSTPRTCRDAISTGSAGTLALSRTATPNVFGYLSLPQTSGSGTARTVFRPDRVATVTRSKATVNCP